MSIDMELIYNIPYSLFKPGTKVVIYGAGKTGSFYIRDIIYSKRLYLVAVIDNNGINYDMNPRVPVYKPEMITELEYDYVFIATENYQFRNEMTGNLRKLGVPDEKVIWLGDFPGNERGNGWASVEYEKFLLRNLDCRQKKAVVFMLPEHSNVGDYLIGIAEQEFLHTCFPDIKVLGVTTAEWKNAKDRIISIISPDDLILINGGGYFGDLYYDFETSKSIIDCFPDNKKVFFPNTLTYKQEPNDDNNSFEDDIRWLNCKKNLRVFFRDELSYVRVSDKYSYSRLYPDMALSMCFSKQDEKRGKMVVLCFRNDDEMTFGSQEGIKDQLRTLGINYVERDLNHRRYIPQDVGRELVNEIISLFQSSYCVITDRLHGMLMSVISDTPCIAFDNSTKKISEVYKWISEYVLLSKEEDGVLLKDLMEEAVQKKKRAGRYRIPIEEYRRMAGEISDFWRAKT